MPQGPHVHSEEAGRETESRRRGHPAMPAAPLTVDEAIIALLIAAMDANQHVSPEEAARAHHIIWSMKRFRHETGERIGRIIEAMKALIEARGPLPVLGDAARIIPEGLRLPAFAVSVDLVLADGRIEAAERRFLDRLATDLGLEPEGVKNIVDVMLVKNSV